MESYPISHPDISELFVYNRKEEAVKAAALEIIESVNDNPEIAITYATGDTMIPVYKHLAQAKLAGQVDFSKTTAFHLDEYYPYGPEGKYSFVRFLKELVFEPLEINPDNIHTLNGKAPNPHFEAEHYEDLLYGQVRLALLGIGPGGHIGFNECGTPFESKTHLAQLSEETVKRDKEERGQDTPDMALTQGISTIMNAEKILLVAYGTTKGDYLNEALFSEISNHCPASALRLHGHKVSIIIDKDASLKIV